MAILLPFLAHAAFAASGVFFAARPIFGPAATVHGILPLAVDLAVKEPFSGKIVASIRDIPDITVEFPLNVGSGRFKYEIALPVGYEPRADVVHVRLYDSRRRLVGKQDLEIEFCAPHPIYAGITQGPLFIGVIGRSGNRRFGKPVGMTMGATGVGLSESVAELLPEDPSMYEAIGGLVLPASEAILLSRRQVTALDAWVRSGGCVLVDGSCSTPDAESSVLLSRYDIRPGANAGEITTPYGYFLNLGMGHEVTNRTANLKLALKEVSIAERTCGDGQNLRTEILVGLGNVVVTCVDLRALTTAEDREMAGCVLRDLMTGDESGFSLARGSLAFPSAIGPWNMYRRREIQAVPWAVALFRLTGLEPISRRLVLTFLILFVAIVCPIERLVLRRMNRLRWTWWVTLAVALVFSAAAGIVSRASRGTQPRRSMLCVHDYAVMGGGRHTFFDCFIPSRSRSVTSPYKSRDIVREVAAQNMGVSARFLARSREVEFSSPVWSPHFLLTSRPHDEAPPFLLDMKLQGGRPAGGAECLVPTMKVKDVWIAWNGVIYQTRLEGRKWTIGFGTGTVTPAGWEIWPTVGGTRDFLKKRLIDDILLIDHAMEPVRTNCPQKEAEHRVVASMSSMRMALPHTEVIGRPDLARLIAVCERGETLTMESRNPKETSVHVVRQIVNVQPPLDLAARQEE